MQMFKIIKKYLVVIVGTLTIVNLLLVAVLLSIRINSGGSNSDKLIDPGTYQALFLTNDQIYFGHLKNEGSDFLLLSDVYYVKIDDNGAGQLVKLGAIEPHGPQDKMIINKDQVLFWENLTPNSQVMRTIQNYNK